jgi:hypothetical protein
MTGHMGIVVICRRRSNRLQHDAQTEKEIIENQISRQIAKNRKKYIIFQMERERKREREREREKMLPL